MVYRFADYTLDPAGREVRHGTQRLALEPKVFQVLLYLLEHRDRVVPRAELLAQCWPETFVSEAALTRCLARLRKAVQPMPSAPQVIETLHRHGYRFVADVTVLAPTPPPTPVDTALPLTESPFQTTARPVLPLSPEPHTLSAPPPSAPLPALPVRPTSSGAERRQLTVLCCDVVDSTTLAGQLDPEDLREMVGQYHATCTAVIQRYGGYVAQYRGMEILVYFGWSQANEDDARRAVHAGLALVMTIHTLGKALRQDAGGRLAMRIGIYTGLVVVGIEEGDAPYGALAVGATPHLAEQMQSLAAPDTVLMSDATYHLVQGYFVCEPLEAHRLPGTTVPGILYQVRGASAARGRLDVTAPQQRTPFVGREAELAVLRARAAQVRQGMGQVVLLSGEAGIGKSRLVQEVTTTLVTEGFTTIEGHGSPYAQHTPLHPVIAWLQRCVHDDAETSGSGQMARLEAFVHQAGLDLSESLPLLATLLGLDLPHERYSVLQLPPQRQRQRLLETLVALVLAHAERQPVLVLVEDLHWVDPTTLEWIGMVIDQGPTAPLCTLLTCRPTFASPWGGRAHVTLLSVPRLPTPQVTQMVQWLGGDHLSTAQVQHIVTQTDGVPLFVEEVTKFVLAAHRLQGDPSGPASGSTAPEVPIPVTLQDSLMARLDQLGAAKGTAQLGATIGREFPAALLQAVTPLDEDMLRQDLAQMVEAELLYQRGVGATAVYQFTHALIQEAAYASLLRRTRQHYHRHIAQALETQFPDMTATQPEVVAHHYTEAGLHDNAVAYWQQAGAQASARSAHQEAIRHLTKGLEILTRLPDTQARTQRELTLSVALAPPLLVTKGYAAADLAHAYYRVQQLCHQVGDASQVFPALYGLCLFHLVRGECANARQVGEQALVLACQTRAPNFLVLAHMVLGGTLFFCGALTAARAQLEAGVARYDPVQHHELAVQYGDDPGVFCLSYLTIVLWLLGYPDQAQARSMAAQAWADEMLMLATEQGFAHWHAQGLILRGWAVARQGHLQEGTAHLRQGLAAWRAIGAGPLQPYWLGLLVETSWWAGQYDEGLHTVAEALAVGAHNQEPWWEAQLYALQGELLLAQHGTPSPPDEVEACFHHALASARRQQAKSLELRAAMSLARLWQQQGRGAEAHELLTPIYAWFTEGFETPDLQEAKALLAQGA